MPTTRSPRPAPTTRFQVNQRVFAVTQLCGDSGLGDWYVTETTVIAVHHILGYHYGEDARPQRRTIHLYLSYTCAGINEPLDADKSQYADDKSTGPDLHSTYAAALAEATRRTKADERD